MGRGALNRWPLYHRCPTQRWMLAESKTLLAKTSCLLPRSCRLIWQDTILSKFDRTKVELAELRKGCTARIDQQISINHVKDKQLDRVDQRNFLEARAEVELNTAFSRSRLHLQV